MTTFEAYVLVMLSNVRIMLSVSTAILGIAAFAFTIAYYDPLIHDRERLVAKPRNILIPLFVISGILLSLLPSTKQAATIILLPAIVNNEHIQTTVGNGIDLMDLTTEWLKDQMSDKIKETKQ